MAALPHRGGTNPKLLHDLASDALLLIAAYVADREDPPALNGRDLADEAPRPHAETSGIEDAAIEPGGDGGETFRTRLHEVAQAQVALSSSQDQDLRIMVASTDECPKEAEGMVLLAARKLVETAVRDGFHARVSDRVTVGSRGDRGLRLSVADNGWSCAFRQCSLPELAGVQAMAASAGGTISFTNKADFTAVLTLPGSGP